MVLLLYHGRNNFVAPGDLNCDSELTALLGLLFVMIFFMQANVDASASLIKIVGLLF